jgi:pimeloyl-ACP methyl ester carboxylesterase
MIKRIIPQALLSLGVILVAISCQQSGPQQTEASNETIKPSESGYANINGLKMYYEVYGSGDPIVLVHGSYMNIPMNWSELIPALAVERKVIVAEMQGHGRTRDTEREFSYEGMADDVSALLTHLKIDSADVLGYSMGGGVAFQFAVRHPEQLRKLVVLSGTYTHDGWWPEVEAMYGTFTADMFNNTPIKKQYDSLGNDPAHFEDFVKKVISIDLKPYDWSADVKKIKSPVFMAIGDADGVRYEHALELFRAMGGGKMGDINGLPDSRLAIIPGTTHIGMMQRTQWLVPMINDFLEAKPGTPPPTF